MRKIKKAGFFLLTIIFLTNCSNSVESSKSNEEVTEENSNDENGYHDGTFCAEVTYNNPKTGTNSNYILLIEVQNGNLVKINWPNGGWLDDTHFSPPDIESGHAEFTTNESTEYIIEITGNENDCNLSNDIASELTNQIDRTQEEEETNEHERKESLNSYCSSAYYAADEAHSNLKKAYNSDELDEITRYLKKAMNSFEESMEYCDKCKCRDGYSSADNGYSYAKKGYNSEDIETAKEYARKAKNSADEIMYNTNNCKDN
jgi:hypothetical protein